MFTDKAAPLKSFKLGPILNRHVAVSRSAEDLINDCYFNSFSTFFTSPQSFNIVFKTTCHQLGQSHAVNEMGLGLTLITQGSYIILIWIKSYLKARIFKSLEFVVSGQAFHIINQIWYMISVLARKDCLRLTKTGYKTYLHSIWSTWRQAASRGFSIGCRYEFI